MGGRFAARRKRADRELIAPALQERMALALKEQVRRLSNRLSFHFLHRRLPDH